MQFESANVYRICLLITLMGCHACAALGSRLAAAAERPVREVIDEHLRQGWQSAQLTAAPLATDSEFLRRVYLDLIGSVPTYEETKAFLADSGTDKRAKLIDQLLADPRYAEHQGTVWDLVLFGRNPPGIYAGLRPTFQKWIIQQFRDNVPYDQMVLTLLKAEGTTVNEGVPMFLAQYKGDPEGATVAVTQTFLGMQLQCAQCHNHPFDEFLQSDFYSLAGFFARVTFVDDGKKDGEWRLRKWERNQGEVLFTGPAKDAKVGDEGKSVPVRFLKGEELEEPPLPKGFQEPRNLKSGELPPKPLYSRLDRLAEWIVKPDNPYFARAVVNRTWGQFMGRGIVHPVDNLGSKTSKPSHPELLDRLTQELVARKFDLKWLICELVNSQAYQLGSTGPGTEDLPRQFERAPVRPLSLEQYLTAVDMMSGFDAVQRVAGKDPVKARNSTHVSTLTRLMGKPLDGVGDYQGSILTQLYFSNHGYFRLPYTTAGDKGLLGKLTDGKTPAAERVNLLFLTVLNRTPSTEEIQLFSNHLTAGSDPRADAESALWVLLTSSEFCFNH